MSTVFSMIIDGQIPGNFAWADEQCVVFASINPISAGHMLVVPRQEVAKYTDADDALLAHLMMVSKRVGRAVEKAFDAPRAAVIIAGFEVPHLHIHVVPAWGEAELKFENAAQEVDPDELKAATERVRAALRELGEGEHVPAVVESSAL